MEMKMSELQLLAENWIGLLGIAVSVILFAQCVPFLLISGLRHELRFESPNLLIRAEVALITSACTCLIMCLLDVFFLHTVLTTFAAITISVFSTTVIAGYVYFVAWQRYGLSAHINNGH
jgi:hypothetical protein